LRAGLKKISSPALDAQRRRATEAVLRVRSVLQHSAASAQASSPAAGATSLPAEAVDDVAARLRQLSPNVDKDQYHATAANACLRAVQVELRRAEPEILALFNGTPMLGASAAEIAQRFSRAALGISIIPVPEVKPLLDGLAKAVRSVSEQSLSDAHCAHLAELLVAIDLYLDSVVGDSNSLTPLLQHAATALESLNEAASQHAHAAYATDASLTQALTESLPAPQSNDDVLEVYLAAQATAIPWLQGSTSDHLPVVDELQKITASATRAGFSELAVLASSAVNYLNQPVVESDARELVSETFAVVPQLLHTESDASETVRGYDDLLAKMQLDPLDNTLLEVFTRECEAHIDTLRSALSIAREGESLSATINRSRWQTTTTLSN